MVLNHRYTRPLLVVLATATALAAAPAVAYADDSRPAPVTGGIPLINTAEKIGPGINLKHVKALDQKGWYDAQFLTVNLPATLSYGLADNVAKTMRFAIGHGGTVVSGGQVVKGLDTSIAPRTALGFKDGGRTLVLATWDGPGGTGKGGVGIDKEARDLAAMGVETAVNLDGGGSTTMVARALGEDDATVRNVPSDGHERNDPNGVGVFVAKGDGKLHEILVKPAPGAASADGDMKVFPGLRRALVVRGLDKHETPVPVDQKSVQWSADEASVEDGTLMAPAEAGTIKVKAQVGGEHEDAKVTVLGPLNSVELSSQLLSMADARRPSRRPPSP
ncbi:MULTISPECIES: phosphodiester glycosidase family protein [unclassified Streptomyces]|uniref:phosphodiester glycosidase family protein n=1 Tax=unclassified Streptomyces TaxID=2593676 RepID=UPI00136C1B61|nr:MULTISPECIES: phosphodiester glycosidase family protein [unclassified Streptomyces]MYZ35697.1 hypothetical protein [Streptomyces sp. SID4917]